MIAQWSLAVAALCTAFSGFTALALAMDRHWEDAFGRGAAPGRARAWLRTAGTLGLLLSLAASLALEGRAQGWVVWLGVLTAAAQAVVLVLSYAARRAGVAGIAAACLGLAAFLALLGR